MILGLALLLTGCAGMRQGLYERAMAHERSKSGLVLKTIMVNEKSISILERAGEPSAPAVVLVHGFGANKENWIRFARYLPDAWRVVAVDLPGHGDSVKDFDLRYGYADQAGYLNEIITHLKIEKFHMAGNSMGGAICALYAVAWPDQVESLLLIDPAGIFVHESELIRLLDKGENPLIVETKDDFYRLMDFAMEKKPYIPWPIAGVMAEKVAANRAIHQKIFSEMHNEDYSAFADQITKITAPALILWGTEDRIIDVGNAEEFQRRIPGSKIVVLEGVGHAPMIEVPEKSAKLFTEFVADCSPAEAL